MRFNTQRLFYITVAVSLILGIGRRVYEGWSGMETFYFFYPFSYAMYHSDVYTCNTLVWYEIDTIQEFVAFLLGWIGLGVATAFPFFLLYEIHRWFWNITKIR